MEFLKEIYIYIYISIVRERVCVCETVGIEKFLEGIGGKMVYDYDEWEWRENIIHKRTIVLLFFTQFCSLSCLFPM